MDANLLRMVTRDSGVRKLLGAKSQPVFEAVGVCKTRLDLFSGISEILLIVNQKMRRNTR
jgi:hypothetical protein